MAVLSHMAEWLERGDQLAPADAILVLDGGEKDSRVSTALDLLARGFAPRVVISQSVYCVPSLRELEAACGNLRHKIHWLTNHAASTLQEAVEARRLLNKLGCASVLVVTSGYHTRRAREIYARELARDGVRVRVYPAPVPGFHPQAWWKTQTGRATVLLESVKYLFTWLHVDPPIPTPLRERVKQWVGRTIP